ncbi:phospholipase A2 inhibitor gamma subunit B-like [Mustelus asterias]
MKLFCVFAIICTSLIEVQSLTCNFCSGSPCVLSQTTCDSTVTNCETISTTLSLGALKTSTVIQTCDIDGDSFSFKSDFLSFVRQSTFCVTDLCNTQTTPDPPNLTENGLQCYECLANDEKDCTSTQKVVKCVGDQNACLSGSGTQSLFGTNPIFVKGCASTNLCAKSIDLSIFSINLTPLPTCCETNLCNTANASTTVPPTTTTVPPTTTTVPPTTTTVPPTTTTVPPTTTTVPPTTTTASSDSGSNESGSDSGGSSD